MKHKLLISSIAILLAVVAIPVAIQQLNPRHRRELQAVETSDVTYDVVEFRNHIQSLDLSGMLFVPDSNIADEPSETSNTDGPYPAVVIIHGSGTSRRDNRWYLTICEHLRNNGIVVLLPDKRGCEGSQGDWQHASFNDLSTDAEAAIEYLRSEHGDLISGIGVLGASQGGQIVPIVGQQSGVSFVINLVGSVVPFHDALLYEENKNLREVGFLPGISNLIAYASSVYIRRFGQPDFWDSIGNYDPLPNWQQVHVPSLILFGELDTNTPWAISAERFEALRKTNIQVVTFTGSGHMLEDPVGLGNDLVRSDALEKIRAFIVESVTER